MLILGMMSGTSVDGIDVALVEIDAIDTPATNEVTDTPRFQWRLHHFTCIPWQAELRSAILDVCRPDARLQDVTALHFRLGEAFATAAQRVVEEAERSFNEIDAIASHGQTVWHQPEPYEMAGMAVTGTMQIGEPSIIAARTGCRVVADFRPADMAAGGQGAPLVPFADHALFRSPEEHRIIQNIGGIANLTYLPANGRLSDLIAFDTGPGNMLIDALVFRLSDGERRYDAGGEWAAEGEVDVEVLKRFMGDSYFAQPPPRTTGRERFGMDFAERFWEVAGNSGAKPADLLATATCLTAESISRAYHDFLPCFAPRVRSRVPITIIVGGGGAHNRTLMRMLAERIAPARLTTHQEFGLPDDAKEAVAFALLAHETLSGRPSNVPSATGATGPAILGKICLPLCNTL